MSEKKDIYHARVDRLSRDERILFYLPQILGYAQGQRDAFNQLDFGDKNKCRDLLILKDMVEGLEISLEELRILRSSLPQEINRYEKS